VVASVLRYYGSRVTAVIVRVSELRWPLLVFRVPVTEWLLVGNGTVFTTMVAAGGVGLRYYGSRVDSGSVGVAGSREGSIMD
jgi:hypothetical protein